MTGCGVEVVETSKTVGEGGREVGDEVEETVVETVGVADEVEETAALVALDFFLAICHILGQPRHMMTEHVGAYWSTDRVLKIGSTDQCTLRTDQEWDKRWGGIMHRGVSWDVYL